LEIFSILITCRFIVKFFVEYFFLIKKGFNKDIGQFLYIFIPDSILGRKSSFTVEKGHEERETERASIKPAYYPVAARNGH
jgi:hypothetical protein